LVTPFGELVQEEEQKKTKQIFKLKRRGEVMECPAITWKVCNAEPYTRYNTQYCKGVPGGKTTAQSRV
jgi:hypothetical protein